METFYGETDFSPENYENIEEMCNGIEHLSTEYNSAIVVLTRDIVEASPNYIAGLKEGDIVYKSSWISRMREIATAMKYYDELRNGNNPLVIISGGEVSLDGSKKPTLSSVMKQELVTIYAIPEENILTEEFSIDTVENAQFSTKILKTLGFLDKGEVFLVTGEDHLERASSLFKKEFKGKIVPIKAEKYMIDFEGELPGYETTMRYGVFAEKYLESELFSKLKKEGQIIYTLSKIPGAKNLMNKLAKHQRSKGRKQN